MCETCPCRGTGVECLQWPAFCATLAHGDDVQRRHVVERSRMGGTPADPAATYPPPLEQAGNLAGALGRVVAAIARGQPVKVPAPVYYERLAICRGCDFNGERPIGVRCTKCGCGEMKLQIATETCPVGKW